jgi:hypothetical protein
MDFPQPEGYRGAGGGRDRGGGRGEGKGMVQGLGGRGKDSFSWIISSLLCPNNSDSLVESLEFPPNILITRHAI